MRMQKKYHKRLIAKFSIVIATMISVVLVVACNPSDDAMVSETGINPLTPAPEVKAEPLKPLDAAYEQHEGQYYSYKRKDGSVSMLAWLGHRDGIHQMMQMSEQGISMVYACADTCKSVTVYEIAVKNPPKIVSTKRLPATPDLPAVKAVSDAAAGHLEQFVQLISGGKAKGQLWVSPEEGPLVIPLQ
jgi:hypothetical protein